MKRTISESHPELEARAATAATKATMTAPEVVALRSTALEGETLPDAVLLAPWGRVESTQGDFLVDAEAAALVIEAFEEHGTDLPIDYEHQTLGGRFSAPDGQAPAAAWVKEIFAEAGRGLLARIEWTDNARKRLLAREYRYLSPVALIRRHDRKLAAIHSAALTNKPAIVGMAPIINRDAMGVAPPSAAEAWAAASIPDDAPEVESEVVAADTAQAALLTLRADLSLQPDVPVHEVLVAAGRRLRHMQQAARRQAARERVAAAVRAGRLIEAQRAWAEELALKDEASFEEWFRTAPVVIAAGRIAPPQHGADAGNGRRRALAARARAEYRANPLISRLTSEEAYVADALRIQNGE